MQWSNQQAAIFEWFGAGVGNLVVRARAGTGKTTTLTEGLNRAPEKRILYAAFNKRIVVDVQPKIKNPRVDIKTLHSLNFGYARQMWSRLTVDDTRNVRIAQEICGGQAAPDEMVALVSKLAAFGKALVPLTENENDLIAIAQERELEPDPEWERNGWDTKRVAFCAAEAMVRACEADGTISFDDMIFVPLRNNWLRPSYDLVAIDECQDMSPAQILSARRVCKPGGRVVVVGDDRQAIYGFRGADSGSLDRLKEELTAAELGLTITRRCPKAIVALAAKLVPDFEAAPEAPEGTVLDININALPEAAQVGDFVLSRKNAPLMSTCLRILRTGKRARIEGKDVGKGLCGIVNKIAKGKAKEDMGIFLERLAVWEEREVSKWDKAGKPSKADEKRDIAETLRQLAEGLETVPEMKARIDTLFSDDCQSQACVVLSSIHKSKGLEAERVFILEDTLYPGGRTDDPEEINIAYVAITRSKSVLTWVNEGKKPEAK